VNDHREGIEVEGSEKIAEAAEVERFQSIAEEPEVERSHSIAESAYVERSQSIAEYAEVEGFQSVEEQMDTSVNEDTANNMSKEHVNSLVNRPNGVWNVGICAPLFRQSPTEWPVLLTILMQTQKIYSVIVREGCRPVITLNGDLYDRAVKLKNYKDHWCIRLGALHTIFVALKCFGKYIYGRKWVRSSVGGGGTLWISNGETDLRQKACLSRYRGPHTYTHSTSSTDHPGSLHRNRNSKSSLG